MEVHWKTSVYVPSLTNGGESLTLIKSHKSRWMTSNRNAVSKDSTRQIKTGQNKDGKTP